MLDRSHCFRDRTEESRPPEEERDSVSKCFRQVGDDREIQLNQLEESVTISKNSDLEEIHRTSTPFADRLNYTTQKSVNCDDLHKKSLSSPTTVEEPVLRSRRLRRMPNYLEDYEQFLARGRAFPRREKYNRLR